MQARYLVVAVLIAMAGASASAQSVKAGIEAWQRADYGAAVAIWRPLAAKGDADAAFNLGQAYRLGRGVTISLSQAQSWFQRAASAGHVDAQTTLGLLLFQNGDQVQGLKWLRQASDQGEPRALLVYGTALYNGDGVPQDRVLGYAYVSRAASAGLAPAKETLEQLDNLMPPGDRAKALALSHSIPNGSPVGATKVSKPVRVAQAKPPASKLVVSDAPRPKPVKADPPRPKPVPPSPATGDWRIQLGAFGQQASAEALYRRVSGKASLAGRRPFFVRAGNVIRLQVGPFVSRPAAQSACASLGVACFPVSAK